MTGRYQQRYGHEFNPGPVRTTPVTFGLSLNKKTHRRSLEGGGLCHGLVRQIAPRQRAANSIRSSAASISTSAFSAAPTITLTPPVTAPIPSCGGTRPVAARWTTQTEAFGRKAVDFIEQHQTRNRGSCYLPFNAVHAPLQATEKYQHRFAGVLDPKRQNLLHNDFRPWTMPSALCSPRSANMTSRKTLSFIFFSDNGGPTPAPPLWRTRPLHSFKATTLGRWHPGSLHDAVEGSFASRPS